MTTTVSHAFVDALVRLGVTRAFGVMGGAIAPLFRAISTSSIAYAHTRHEAGAAFAASEASLVTRAPVVVFTTSGPGMMNALTGMMAARLDGAHVLLISAATSAPHHGRCATQETSPTAIGAAGLLATGGAFHYATTLAHPAQLGPIVAQLATGFARPQGFVAHVSIPIDIQNAPATPVRLVARTSSIAMPPPEVVDHHADMIAGHALAIWVGYGARDATAEIRRLAERTNARVISTPRGKGIFPESHPLFLGVTGIGGHTHVEEAFGVDRPAYTLVLGTRISESSSFWSSELAPSEAFIHVDLDPAVFGAAYPETRTHGVVAEIARYCDALVTRLGDAAPAPARTRPRAAPPMAPRATGRIRPQVLFAEMQRAIVEGSDAWMMAESGNSFCWSSHLLSFDEPGRYRVSQTWGSMGHATTGVVGAALARGGKAFAIAGDGSMMMLNELHAAVQHRADAVWVILNDACYLMCSQGMTTMGWEPFSCELPEVDFVALATAVGAGGERIDSEAAIAGALERALHARGPWVLDVRIDPAEIAPSGRRNRSLMQQGFAMKGAS